jgi:hypothetical protein
MHQVFMCFIVILVFWRARINIGQVISLMYIQKEIMMRETLIDLFIRWPLTLLMLGFMSVGIVGYYIYENSSKLARKVRQAR